MSEWATKYDLKGKPVITTDKPGHRIEKVLDELQDKCINEVEGSEGSGKAPVTVNVEMLTNQTAKISADADMGGYSEVGHDHDGRYALIDHNHDGVYAPAGTGTFISIKGVTASLTTSGTRLTLTLTFQAESLDLATMLITPTTIPPVTAYVDGEACG